MTALAEIGFQAELCLVLLAARGGLVETTMSRSAPALDLEAVVAVNAVNLWDEMMAMDVDLFHV